MNQIIEEKIHKFANCDKIHHFHGQECHQILTSIPVCQTLRYDDQQILEAGYTVMLQFMLDENALMY